MVLRLRMRMAPGLRRGLALAAVGAAWIGGCSRAKQAAQAPPPPVVSVVEARRMTVPIMAEPIGTTVALQEVSVRARVRGFLKEMHFAEGGEVKKGQLLFVIDEEPFKAELAAAKAKLEQAEASLKKAQDSRSREVAAAQRALSQSLLDLAKVEERREEALFQRKATSVEDVERKRAIRKRDAAQVDADQASLEQANADYGTALLGAQADVAYAKAQVVNAEIELGYCRMMSPIDGRIGLAKVKPGNLVGPATNAGMADFSELAVIRQLDPIGVDVQVASAYLEQVTKLVAAGLPIEIYRPGGEGRAGRRFPGKTTAIDNSIDETTSTFRVRSEVPNPEKMILPGEYVKVDVKVGEVGDAVVVPQQAVIETQAGPTVSIVDERNKVAVVPVKASFTYNGLRVLEGGIRPGQKVIVEGLQSARPGTTVRPEPAPPEIAAVDAQADGNAPAGKGGPGQAGRKP
ncbi:Toluene efflux pump periplasmic linker protein TtgG precursor [Aquisphaera giovannonii]|uniref:Toluene efflux pump periplasmic linker protein TtgG n=1 Tax=Aquisphaera giovannonii TaxID=406548 RepID=A0A5B9W7B2_9BACT|nr:efflux RND transporter periplasmic adaptor subunit [Aquisphaera giovannonii]QEH36237.1 Toluene efflux pump periplasmic linker protein TtgG precursor [Aquisphaera giovannonii]